MVTAIELTTEVDDAFAERDPSLVEWPSPWPDRSPADDAYSVCADPLKYRLLGARTDAWAQVLVTRDVMQLEREVTTDWIAQRHPGPNIGRTDRWIPSANGTIPFVVGRLTIDLDDDVGLVLGAGEPPVVIQTIPDCGCDACDSGSGNDLAWIDSIIMSAVTGVLRYAQAEHHSETRMIDSNGRNMVPGRRFRGWDVVVEGAPWLSVTGVDAWLATRP